MRVLVTGATGFIGSRTVLALAQRGHEVVATGRAEPAQEWLTPMEVRYATCDLNDVAAVERLFRTQQPDAVVHLAWYTNPRSYLTSRAQNVASLAAGAHLLVAAERSGCSRVVLGGTCLETIAAETIYARTKRAMHAVAAAYFEGDEPRVACAHIFSVYGPGEHPDRAIPSITRALLAGEVIDLTDGAPRRDYLHVDDVALGLSAIAEATIVGSIDVCSGSARPVRDIFSLLGTIIGRPDLLRFGSVPHSGATSFEVIGDPSPLMSLGWAPTYSLETGLTATVRSIMAAYQAVPPT